MLEDDGFDEQPSTTASTSGTRTSSRSFTFQELQNDNGMMMLASANVVKKGGVSVSNPEHVGTGRQKHTTYLVQSNFQTKSLVRRRYSDFQDLRQRLQEEVPVWTCQGEK